MTDLMMLAPVLSRTPSPISREVSASHFTIQFLVTWPTMIAPTGGSLLDAFSNIVCLEWRKRPEKNMGKTFLKAQVRLASHCFTVLDSLNFWYANNDV